MANEVNILVSTDLKGSVEKFQKVAKTVAKVSAAVAGVGLALTKVSDEFTVASRNITAGTGATGKELEALKKEFRDVAGSVPQDFDTVSKAIADVKTELGLSGDALEETTKRFLDLSRVTGTEVEPLIKQVSDSMDLFGLSSDEAGSAMDSFARASQLTGVPIAQLTSRVTEFGPVLRNMQLGMNDSIALLGQLEGAGISASRVMPGLNQSMRNMAATGVQDLGEGLFEAMRAIEAATTDTEALNLATDLFGAEGAQRMKVAIQDGTVDIQEMATALGNAGGTVDDMTEGTLTASEQFKIFTNDMKLAIEPISGVAGAIGPILFMLPATIAAFSALAGMMSAASLASAGATIKTAAHTIALGVQTAASWLATAGMTALNIALGPVGLAIAAIAVAILAAILIWKNWDTIVNFVKESLSGIADFISGGFSAAMDLGGKLVEGFKETMTSVLDGIKELWQKFVDKLWGPFDEFMTDKLGGAWTTFKVIVSAALDIVKGYFNGFVETLQGLWDIIVGLFTGDTEKIKEGFKGIVNGILTMFNGLIKAVNKIGFQLPDWLGGKGFSLNIPEIPKLAEGGIVERPTLAMIGESGPEAVVPLNKASGGLGGGVVVNVTMPEGGTVIMDDEQTMQRFGDFITREIRQVLRTQGGF
ncbi:hypothetical protein [uncultured Mediterranean phage uvDeep-CGR2-KM18-C74]|nr:hypothetical protein [uncultured Mediterranean phage uvDeep-CGR2-KM18-C74]